MLTPDDFISFHKACEEVVEAERNLDNLSPQAQIAVLRSCVRTLAVVQRDLVKAVLES